MHLTFSKTENNFWQNYGNFNLDNFQVRLQCGVASLCNQLLPEVSSNQFETLHRCYKHIEDMHVTSCRGENNFWQNYGILDVDNFEVRFQKGVARLCNQLLSEFSSIQFETLHRYYKFIEDVYVTFCSQKYNLWQNYCNFDFDLSDISLQYRLNMLEGHGWGWGKG